MAHGFFCNCKKCNPSMMDILSGAARTGNSFKKTTRKGETIWGDKRKENKESGYKHGHDWGTGGRREHSNLGHQAVHGKTHRADRRHYYGDR